MVRGAAPARDRRIRLRIERYDGSEGADCVADQVSARWSDALGRALAPLRDGSRATTLATECSLLALHGGPDATRADDLAARWRRGGEPIATIGAMIRFTQTRNTRPAARPSKALAANATETIVVSSDNFGSALFFSSR